MKKIKVLEMIDLPFLGGGQINLLSIAKSLDMTKFEVSVCSQGDGPLVDEAKRNNIRHFPVPFSKKINRKVFQEIAFILKSNKIDILHTHGGVAGFYGRWAANRNNIPVVVHTLHGIHYLHYRNCLLKHFYILLERYFSRFTDALIFVSDADRKKGKKLKLAPEDRIYVIKNGIDFSAFLAEKNSMDFMKQWKRELDIESFQPVVGTVSRLHRQKGIPYLLEAAKKILKVFPAVKILIVGEGPQRQKLESLNRRLGLENYVLFLGERKDAQQFLFLFDVFVLPSLWEGLPYVLMEAAALGKPVVATDVDGVKEMVRDGESGILVPSKNPESLARSVIQLLQDRSYALELGKELKKEISQKYTLSSMVEQIQSLYLELYGRSDSITVN